MVVESKGIDGRVQVDSQVLVGVQAARFGDKHLGKLGIDAPVAPLVGIGQIVAGDRGANAHVEELGSHMARRQASISRKLSR